MIGHVTQMTDDGKVIVQSDVITPESWTGIDNVFLNEWNNDPDLPHQWLCYKIFHKAVPEPEQGATPEALEEYRTAWREEYERTNNLITSANAKRNYLREGGYNAVFTDDEHTKFNEYKTSEEFNNLPPAEQTKIMAELLQKPECRFAESLFTGREDLQQHFNDALAELTPDSFQWFIDRLQRNYKMIIHDIKRSLSASDTKESKLLTAYQNDLKFCGNTHEFAAVYLRIYLSLYLYAAKHAPEKYGENTLDSFIKAISNKVLSWNLPESNAADITANDILSRANSIDTTTAWLELDKATTSAFTGRLEKALEESNAESVPVGVEGQNAKQQISVYMSINRDAEQLMKEGVSISKRLNSFDWLVHDAVYSLMRTEETQTPHPNYTYSINEIGGAMGYNSINKRDKEKIYNSIKKMRFTIIGIDNREEVAAHYTDKEITYSGALLPSEDVSLYVGGQLTKRGIHFFRRPPLSDYAQSKNQISCFPKMVLQAPVNKTEINLTIERYLEARILHMKNPKSKHTKGWNKILLDTLFKNCNITTAMQKSRAKKSIKTILDHYKKRDEQSDTQFIKKYEMKPDAIIITPVINQAIVKK